METFPATIVLRHKKENLKKCSLRGLEGRDDFTFLTYPKDTLPDLSGYLHLKMDAPPLTADDFYRGLFILDATWRYAERMLRAIGPLEGVVERSIPPAFRTAYPRRQEDCAEPERGLSSVEAIMIAYHIMGRDAGGVLDQYYWKEAFLEKNRRLWK